MAALGSSSRSTSFINSMFNLNRFRRSLQVAWTGLRHTAQTENSFRIHLFAAAVALLLTILLRVRPLEAAIVVLVIAIVLTMELVNTVVERFVGILEPRVHPYVKVIKDILAAAVLLACLPLMGMVVVHPKDPNFRRADRDFVFVMSAYRFDPGTALPKVAEMTDFNIWTLNARVFPAIDVMPVRLARNEAIGHVAALEAGQVVLPPATAPAHSPAARL